VLCATERAQRERPAVCSCHAEAARAAAAQVGWKHGAAVAELEEKRKVKGEKYYALKKKLAALRKRAAEQVKE
jgi:hypothetical protein